MSDEKQRLAHFLAGFLTEKRRLLMDRVLDARTDYLRVLVMNPNDPGDAFAVMRSCECFGIQNFHLITAGTNPKLSKGIAVGSGKWITLHRHHGEGADAKVAARLKAEGYRMVAVNHQGGGLPIRRLPLNQKTVLCMAGDEGLSPAIREAVDAEVHVPTRGFSDGFNLSVRAALCFADVRFALERSNQPWRLTEAQRLDLRLEWLAAAPKKIGLILNRYKEMHGLIRLDGAQFTPEFRRITGL